MIKIFSRVFYGVYFLLMLVIIASVCLTYCSNTMNLPLNMVEFDFKGIFIGIFFGIVLTILYTLFKSRVKLTDKQLRMLYIGGALILAAGQLFLLFTLKTKPYSDCAYVDAAARAYAQGEDYAQAVQSTKGHTTYFYQFPNNWAFLILLSNYYKIIYLITGSISIYAPGILNIALMQVGMFMFYKCMKLMFSDNCHSALGIILMLGYAPLYTYSSYCYTDSVSLPFVTAAVYFVIKAKRAEKFSPFMGNITAAGALIAVGYSIKGSLIIIMVSMLMYLIVNVPIKRWLCGAGVTAALFLLFNSVILSNYASASGIATKEQLAQYRFPTTHWIMMGLKDEGGFDVDDHNFTKFLPDYETRKEKSVEIIKERLSEADAQSSTKHIFKKLGFTWGDGTYYINNHLVYAHKGFVKYLVMKGTKSLLYFQSYHFMIITALLLSVINGFIKGKASSMDFVRLTVFGLTVFLLIWETRSRYLFNFIPLMLIMAADGLDMTSELIRKLFMKGKTEALPQTADGKE